jgi:hypothetical protein
MMFPLRHDIGNDIPSLPLCLVVDFPNSALGYEAVCLLGWDGDIVCLPGFISILSFTYTSILRKQVSAKEGKCLNGKEGMLSADPSACDENGKKEIT